MVATCREFTYISQVAQRRGATYLLPYTTLSHQGGRAGQLNKTEHDASTQHAMGLLPLLVGQVVQG